MRRNRIFVSVFVLITILLLAAFHTDAGYAIGLDKEAARSAVTDGRPKTVAVFTSEAARAHIVVRYLGAWPAEAKNAFQYAADAWSYLISSPATITIDANWDDWYLPEGMLSSQVSDIYNDFGTELQEMTWYPTALANCILGRDLVPGGTDMEVFINGTFTGWYFGTDGNPPTDAYDLVTVVLHELGHGFGLEGSANVDFYGDGRYGIDLLPMIYDRFIVNSSGYPLTDFPESWNRDLGLYLMSNDLYWKGPRAAAAAGGARPKIYAHQEWYEEVCDHLDEKTYPAGSANSLMTPAIFPGEAIHNPGPIATGMLEDMGWQLANIPILEVDVQANGSNGPVTINQGDLLEVSVRILKSNMDGMAEYWLVDKKGKILRSFKLPSRQWVEGLSPTIRAALLNYGPAVVSRMSNLSPGKHIFYFAADLVPDGVPTFNAMALDRITVIVN